MASVTGNQKALDSLFKNLAGVVRGLHTSKGIGFPVLCEVVWMVSQVHPDETFQLIDALPDNLGMIYETSPEMQEIRN